MNTDTIASISTAPGESGIGIIRISGKDAVNITNKIYTDKNGNQRKSVEVVANNVSFCGSKNESGTAMPQQNDYEQPAPSYSNAQGSDFEEIIDDEDDELPF